MNKPIQLTLEQQFELRSFKDQVAKMSEDQAKEFLILLREQMMVNEATYRSLLKNHWFGWLD